MENIFESALYPDLETFDEKTQKEILSRLNDLYESILEMENDPLFISLSAKTSIDEILHFFLPPDRKVPNELLRLLITWSDDPDNLVNNDEDKERIDSARDWFADFMRLTKIELNTAMFTGEEILDHWIKFSRDKDIVTLTDEDTGEVLEKDETFRSDGIIWGMACARAESLYGIRLGFSNFLPLFTFLKRDLDTDEHRDSHKPLLELMDNLEGFYKLRKAVEKNESFVEIETLKAITKLNEKTIVNASKKSKEDLIPVDKDGNTYKHLKRERIPRRYFQPESAKKWVLSEDRKQSKEIIYKDSLYYSDEQMKEVQMIWRNEKVVIEVENKIELEQFLIENEAD
tara:strand:+ start:964 stop:1995 length:1032 start_codon:yes stop_codon:yes gene_type:complete